MIMSEGKKNSRKVHKQVQRKNIIKIMEEIQTRNKHTCMLVSEVP